MYISPIYAPPVAFARALARSPEVKSPAVAAGQVSCGDAPAQPNLFQQLARWWRKLDETPDPGCDPAAMMLWCECGGRPYVTALTGVLLMNYLRKRSEAHRLTPTELKVP
jgi:hypothetical protein